MFRKKCSLTCPPSTPREVLPKAISTPGVERVGAGNLFDELIKTVDALNDSEEECIKMEYSFRWSEGLAERFESDFLYYLA